MKFFNICTPCWGMKWHWLMLFQRLLNWALSKMCCKLADVKGWLLAFFGCVRATGRRKCLHGIAVANDNGGYHDDDRLAANIWCRLILWRLFRGSCRRRDRGRSVEVIQDSTEGAAIPRLWHLTMQLKTQNSFICSSCLNWNCSHL